MECTGEIVVDSDRVEKEQNTASDRTRGRDVEGIYPTGSD